MAERVFRNTVGTQGHDAAAYYRGFSEVAKRTYPGESEQFVGEELFGADTFGTDGLHHEAYYHTGLQGQAAIMPTDVVRHRFPMASYRTGSILIQGYRQAGISFEYYPREFEDVLAGFKFLAEMQGDLPTLLRDTEEDMMLGFYNNGESASQLVGTANTPLFVDGNSYVLQLLGNPTYFTERGGSASNIIENGGGVSNAMLALVEQYGDHFVNDEGRVNRLRPVMALGRRQNIRLLSEYLSYPSNIEQFDPNRPNPVAGMAGMKLVASDRLANPNDMIFFFEGWQDDIKMRDKYRHMAESWTEGHGRFEKVVSELSSRIGFYALNNRRVLLVRGAE